MASDVSVLSRLDTFENYSDEINEKHSFCQFCRKSSMTTSYILGFLQTRNGTESFRAV